MLARISNLLSAKRLTLYVAMMMLCFATVSASVDNQPEIEKTGDSTNAKKWKWYDHWSRTAVFGVIFALLAIAMLFCPIPGDNPNINIFNENGGASLFLRLAVIIPSVVFIVGSIGVACYRQHKYNTCTEVDGIKPTFDDWRKKQTTVETCTQWWFISVGVLALVFVCAGTGVDGIFQKQMFVVTFCALAGVGVFGYLAATYVIDRQGSTATQTFDQQVPSPSDTKKTESITCAQCKAQVSAKDKVWGGGKQWVCADYPKCGCGRRRLNETERHLRHLLA